MSCHSGRVVPVLAEDEDYRTIHFQNAPGPAFRLQRISDFNEEQMKYFEIDLEQGVASKTETNIADTQPEAKIPVHKPAQIQPAVSTKSRLSVVLLDQSPWTVYKRLFVVSFVTNLLFLIMAATGNFNYAKDHLALFSIANILMVVLSRSESFLKCVFWLAVKVLGHWWIPVQVKTAVTAFLQSVGGIHAGCGISAVMWLVYAIAETFKHTDQYSRETIGVVIAILVVLLLSCLAAFPALRHFHHNVFEGVHRFAGWTSLGLVWCFIFLSAAYNPETDSYKVDSRLARRQDTWYVVSTTFLVFLPWMTVRKVPVKMTIPPAKNTSLVHFKGGVSPGHLARISDNPLKEWHAFGIISDGTSRHTILAGAVGDFTKNLVENPPTQIWVRTFHFSGLAYLTNMYDKVIHVATGSGICVFLSFLLQPTKADVHIIWITKNVRDSYGEEFFNTVSSISPEHITIFDTAITGRPKITEVVIKKAKEWGAEVVIVTSNPTATNEIMNACKSADIPAFGPIWDS